MVLGFGKTKPPPSPFVAIPKKWIGAVVNGLFRVASYVTMYGSGGQVLTTYGKDILNDTGYTGYYLNRLLLFIQQGQVFSQITAFATSMTGGLFAAVILFGFIFMYGKKRGEQMFKSLKKPKTKPVRDKNGILLVGDGDFPFPAILYKQMESGAPLEEGMIDEQMQTAKNKGYDMDGLMFKFLFVPLSMREERFSERREKEYKEMLEKMGYTNPSKIGVIMRRVSEYDVRQRRDIVREAASFPGVHSDRKWMAKYFRLRRLNKVNA